jgi:hypothetical protein
MRSPCCVSVDHPIFLWGLRNHLVVCMSSPNFFVFYAVHVISKESWLFVLPRTYCYLKRRFGDGFCCIWFIPNTVLLLGVRRYWLVLQFGSTVYVFYMRMVTESCPKNVVLNKNRTMDRVQNVNHDSKNVTEFSETWKFITVVTRAPHRSLSWAQ